MRTHRCCEHFMLRSDLRSAEGELRINVVPLSGQITFMNCVLCVSVLIEVVRGLHPSATLRLHIQAVLHYIMKS